MKRCPRGLVCCRFRVCRYCVYRGRHATLRNRLVVGMDFRLRVVNNAHTSIRHQTPPYFPLRFYCGRHSSTPAVIAFRPCAATVSVSSEEMWPVRGHWPMMFLFRFGSEGSPRLAFDTMVSNNARAFSNVIYLDSTANRAKCGRKDIELTRLTPKYNSQNCSS